MNYSFGLILRLYIWIGIVCISSMQTSSHAAAASVRINHSQKNYILPKLSISGLPIIEVKGDGKHISDGDTKPSAQDYTHFDSLEVDSGSVVRTFWIYNTGSDDLNISGLLTSSNEEEFAVTQPTKLTLTPGDSTSFDIIFTAFHDGIIEANINIPNNVSDENNFVFTVAGIGVGIFDMEVKGNYLLIDHEDFAPNALDGTDFGIVEVPFQTVTATYWIFNTGNVDLTVAPTIIDILNFQVSQPEQTVIPRDDSISFTVTFNPTRHDSIFASVVIFNDTKDKSPYIFTVQGVGLDFSQTAVFGNGQMIVHNDTSPATTDSTDFETASIYTGLVRHTFWIVNTSTVDLHLTGNIETNNDVFTVSQPAATLVPPKDSVSFTITFDPTLPGDTTALVHIPNDDRDQNPFTFLVKGRGTEQVDLPPPGTIGNYTNGIFVKGNHQIIANGDTIPSVIDSTSFGRVNRSFGNITKTYWIVNKSTTPLQLTSDILSNNHVFNISQPVHTTIQPNDSTSFSITFDPENLGEATAYVIILNDHPAYSPYIFAIQGIGTGYIEAIVKGNEQIILAGDTVPSLSDHTDFDSLYINKGSADKTYTFWILNTGTDSLYIALPIVSSSEFFTVEQPNFSKIAAGDSVSFDVTFSSEQTGRFAAMIYIFNDDVARNPYAFKVEGAYNIYSNGIPVAVNDDFVTEQDIAIHASVLIGTGADTLSNNTPNTVYLQKDVRKGTLQLNADGTFFYEPLPGFWGTDTFTYLLCDVEDDCSEATATIQVKGTGITIYNAFSPDDDGVNDAWEIDNITNYASNKVVIFNRWGNKVWEGTNYDNQKILWRGQSNIGAALPDGTYFYLVEVEELGKQQGYVVISRQQ